MATEYDAIVIGAGQNGLTLACYLAKSGFSVVVFEKNCEPGGGSDTQEFNYPGVRYNPHANMIGWMMYAPPVRDLGLTRYLRLLQPEIPLGGVYPDKTCILLYRDNPRKTAKLLERFSKKDAKTYLKMKEEVDRIRTELVLLSQYTPPPPPGEKSPLMKLIEEKITFYHPSWEEMSGHELMCELWEHETVRAFWEARITMSGFTTDERGLPGARFIPYLAISDHYEIIEGGTHRVVHALHRVLIQNGGKVYEVSPVEKIIVKEGRAVGVRLKNGKEVRARKLIASSLNPHLTFLKLIGEEYLDREIIRKVREFEYTPWALFGIHLASKELPNYIANEFCPDVDKCISNYVGHDNTEIIMEGWNEIRRGELPKVPGFETLELSRVDRTLSPPGIYALGAWVYTPNSNLIKGGPDEYFKVREEYAERCLERWREYAPNLTRDKILAITIYTPREIELRKPNFMYGDWAAGSFKRMGANRPFPECGRYKVPFIEGLYLCGPSTHPGGGHRLANGYNCFQVIAEDFKIQRWWS